MYLEFPPLQWVIVILMMVLTGCASPQTRMPSVDSDSAKAEARKQREMVIEEYIQAYRRLQNVASRIVVSGADLCADQVGPYYGFTVWNNENFGKEWHDVVESKFGLSASVSVSSVATDSPAAAAGLAEGDTLVSINGWEAPAGKGASVKVLENLTVQGKAGVPVELVVRRGSEERKFSITHSQACDFWVHLSPDDVKNAYADGKNIVIYKGMMDFFRSDEEVALVVSHELAHNAMRHVDAKQKNAMVGGLLGLVLDVAAAAGGVNTGGDFSKIGSNAGASVYSVEFEQEADYVGLYFMAKAGYPIGDAPNFWRRMATTNSKAITMKSSHPTTPERFVAIENAVIEIQQKIENGQSLRPELKSAKQGD